MTTSGHLNTHETPVRAALGWASKILDNRQRQVPFAAFLQR